MQTFVPCNVSYILLWFPLLFPCPAFSHSPSLQMWVGCVSWFHILPTSLCYFCTEIRRRLPFRSQSHTFRSNFFWHRKQKRALQKNFNFPAEFIRQICQHREFILLNGQIKLIAIKHKKSNTYLISSSWTSYDSTLRRNTWTSPFLKIRKCFVVKFCDRDFMCIKCFIVYWRSSSSQLLRRT